MTQEVRLMIGIPASGKSTWIEQEIQHLEEEHKTTCVISRDYVRLSMLKPGEDYFAHENDVFNEFIRQINEAMELGIDIVFIDATHINPASRNKVLSRLTPDSNTSLVLEIIPVSLSTAIERNAKREGLAKVPDSAIRSMYRGYIPPTRKEFINHHCYGFKDITMKYHEGE